MAEYHDRVIAERDELHDKVVKLGVFIAGAGFDDLAKVDQVLLAQQSAFMQSYLGTLDQRIERF